jgi:hypothetical protein
MKGFPLDGLLRAREARERLAAGRLGQAADALRDAEAVWQEAKRKTENFRRCARARETERFQALSEGATAADWARERETARRLGEETAALQSRETVALRRKEAMEAVLAEARLAYQRRVRERAKLDHHHENWRQESVRSAEASEESEAEG